MHLLIEVTWDTDSACVGNAARVSGVGHATDNSRQAEKLYTCLSDRKEMQEQWWQWDKQWERRAAGEAGMKVGGKGQAVEMAGAVGGGRQQAWQVAGAAGVVGRRSGGSSRWERRVGGVAGGGSGGSGRRERNWSGYRIDLPNV